uniref:RNase H type-1 domain-containing protein n=1 Tax=Cannabis sativa TaxID=3483 RepID=A0A803QHA7_CANSA
MPLDPGWELKVRVDASFKNGFASLGLVQGDVVDEAAMVILQYIKVNNALEAELLAILNARQWAKGNKVNTVLVEFYSSIVVKALSSGVLPFAWSTFPVFHECRALIPLFSNCVVLFIPRADNSLANRLSYYARVSRVCLRCMLREVASFVATI